MASSLAEKLKAAAGGDEAESPEETDAEAYSPDEEHKRAFLDMAKAIKSGNFEAAWKAYQECQELGG
jgi:hypothetical protein